MVDAKYVGVGNTLFNCHIFVPTRFYGRNSSYVHGGLDPSGKLAEAVYGQAVGAISQYSRFTVITVLLVSDTIILTVVLK